MSEDTNGRPTKSTSSSPLRAAAARYRTLLEWPLLALHTPQADGACSCRRPECSTPGKHPRTQHGLKDATTDLTLIDAWFGMWPDANLGVRTGAAAGIIAIDCDPDQGGVESLAQLERRYGPLPATVRARTGGGGAHIVLAHPGGDAVVTTKTGLAPGIDVRGDGGYIVLPPSRHASGASYAWEDGHSPFDLLPAPIPEPWRALLVRPERPRRSEPLPTEPGRFDLTPEQIDAAVRVLRPYYRDGVRHDLSLALAGWLASQHYTEPAVAALIDALARDDAEGPARRRNVATTFARQVAGEPIVGWQRLQELVPPAVSQILEATLGACPRQTMGQHPDPSGPRYAEPPPEGHATPPTAPLLPEHLSDLGNARRLIREHGDELRYCHPWNKWLVWDGRRWAEDTTGAAMRLAKQTVASIYGEAQATVDLEARKALVRHALKSEGVARLDAMLTLARSEPGVPILPHDLDRDPWALNTLSGTLDLRTGAVRPHERADLITKLVPHASDPNAPCPTWQAFLDRIFDGNAELIAFLQRAAGYSISGRTSERALFIAHGTGRNGKSTFLDTLHDLLGADYAMRAPTDLLLATRDTTIPNDVARLQGTRFVFASEAEDGRRLAEAKVKDLTGGDTITARFMRGEWFDFRPEFKLWLGTNHKPMIKGTDDAIWDRLHLVPFTVRIPAAEQDRNLRDKLLAEAPGILAWLVEGCLAWQQMGLGVPDAVHAATRAYRTESDLIGKFIDETCVLGDAARASAKELFSAYETWCGEAGEKPVTKTAFGRCLTERGLAQARIGSARSCFWLGIGLKGARGDGVERG